MSGSPFKTVVLPAVLISTTVFSALTLSFVSRRSEAVTLKLQAADSEEVQASSVYESKDFAIRYVGLTIILSVGSGVLTVEGLRRFYTLRESMQIKRQRSRLEKRLQVQEPQSQPAALVAVGQDIAVVDPLSDSTTHPEIVPAQAFDDYAISTAFEDAHLDDYQSDLMAPLSDWSALSEFDRVAAQQDALALSAGSNGASHSLNTIKTPQILESREQYQTGRIHIPHLQQPQFAILVDGQYYSFVKTTNSRSTALRVATTIAQRGEQSIITRTHNGYAVWNWEPEAFPDLVA